MEIPPFLENIFRVVDQSIFPYCVSILHAKGMVRYEHRSGVLVQIADSHFLVTAAHNLENLHKSGVDSFIVQGEKGSNPVFIQTNKWYTTISEQADLGVCLLDGSIVDYLGDKQKYLRITDFAPKRECGDRWYIIVGWPRDRIGPDDDGVIRCSGWKYVTKRFDRVEQVENYDSEIHLVVKYERDTTDGERIVHPPAMSGCGIWYLPKESPEIVRPDDFKICAIQNAWHKGREYAKGTWTDMVLKIIWTYFPDLQPIMRMHGCRF